MAAQNLVLVTRTDNGKQFKVSTNMIVEFTALQGGTSQLVFIDQRGRKSIVAVNESVATINGLTGSRTQAVTLNSNSKVIYINSDRIIYLDTASFGTIITYDVAGVGGKYNFPPISLSVNETPANINTAAVNTGLIITSDSQTRWINGNLIDLVSKSATMVGDYNMLYNDKKTSFNQLTISSSGSSFLSLGSGWS